MKICQYDCKERLERLEQWSVRLQRFFIYTTVWEAIDIITCMVLCIARKFDFSYTFVVGLLVVIGWLGIQILITVVVRLIDKKMSKLESAISESYGKSCNLR